MGGEGRVVLPFVDIRIDLGVDEADEGAAKLFVLRGELHGAGSMVMMSAL
jgi:hypothetical protein